MRLWILAAALTVCASSIASAQVRVDGYFKNDGTYVAPHYRSSPNSTTLDNYGTRGNVNPYSGSMGTQNPHPSYNYNPPSYNANPYSNPYSAPRRRY